MRLTPLLIGAQRLALPRKHTTIPCGCSAGDRHARRHENTKRRRRPSSSFAAATHGAGWSVSDVCTARRRRRLSRSVPSRPMVRLSRQAQIALLAECHWAGAGIGRVAATFQPFGVFTKTWFMSNRVC